MPKATNSGVCAWRTAITSGLALKAWPCRKVSRALSLRGPLTGVLSRSYSTMSLRLAPPGATKRAMYQWSGFVLLRALTCAWTSRMPTSRVRIRFARTRSSRRACSGAGSAAFESASGVAPAGDSAGCEEHAAKNATATSASAGRLIKVWQVIQSPSGIGGRRGGESYRGWAPDASGRMKTAVRRHRRTVKPWRSGSIRIIRRLHSITMTAERWRRVEEFYHAALARDAFSRGRLWPEI